MHAVTVHKKSSKSANIREILKNIGALSDPPPDGWRQTVEDTLKKEHGQAVHQVRIYQIRREMVAEQQNGGKKKRGRVSNVSTSTGNKYTLEDLTEFQQMAHRFGGLDAVSELVKIMQNLKA